MMFLVLAVLVAATSAATVWLATTRPRRENDPDAAFWYAFAGVCVLLPMVLVPATASKAASLGLLALAAGSALAAHTLVRRRRLLADATTRLALSADAIAAIAAQHGELLRRWSRYELDPAMAMDFPAMTDVRVPETAALIRAVTGAGRLQRAAEQGIDGEDGQARYRCAVAELAAALDKAEFAARNAPGAAALH